ncbi:Redox-active disulfide protein 2 [hydrothermal vent metagenome]|uniref:Redox-active disulfide protein 2 n=1 Tax=hydrothermal vent metagenome TaxID=652676 RepID=A0A3B1E6I2_9ZZZZ
MNRIIRIVVGLGLIGYGIYSGNVWFYLGSILLVTGIMNWCPMEKLMGRYKDGQCDTGACCSSDEDKKESSCCSTESASTTASCCSTPTKPSWSEKPKKSSCCSTSKSGEMVIKILGTGCAKCIALKKVVDEAIVDFDNIKVEKIEDMNEIMSYNIVSMPGFVINEKVITTGKLLKIEEVKNYIKEKQK